MRFTQRFAPVPRIPRARIIPLITQMTREASVEIKDAVQAATPRRTGRFRGSWKRRVKNTTRTVTFTLDNPTPYGIWVHYKGQPGNRVLDQVERLFQTEAQALGSRIGRRLFTLLNQEG